MNRKPVLALLLISCPALAQTVGISQAAFAPHYRTQQTQMWCWAASTEMILSYSGITLPQNLIVTRIMGAPYAVPGNFYQMVGATNGLFTVGPNSVVVSGQFVIGAPQPSVLFNQLKHNRPVILTYNSGSFTGHAVVLTAIDHVMTPQGPSITKFYVFDPFPYSITRDAFGNPQLVFNPTLQYRAYAVSGTPAGVGLFDGPFQIGTVTGMILIDASPP